MALSQTKISQLYVAIFNRASEGAGNTFWQTFSATDSVSQVADAMLGTDAAKSYFGNALNTDQAFIEHIYLNTFSKTIADDPAGIAFWVNDLKTKSRGEVVERILNAAIDPANAGPAQDQFLNRVAISNFTANVLQNPPSDLQILTFGPNFLNVTSEPSSLTDAQAEVLAIAAPSLTFTLTETKVVSSVPQLDEIVGVERVVYWGLAPEVDAPNEVLPTGDYPAIPLSDLLSYIQSLAGIDFVQLGLINIANGTDDGLNNGSETADGDPVDSDSSSSETEAQPTNITISQNGDGTQTVTVYLDDGTVNTAEVQISEQYFSLIQSLLFNEDGSSRLFLREIPIYAEVPDETVTTFELRPITLTTVANSGGTVERGFTGSGDNVIVAGRLELLHQAFIDGGAGYNTLEVDAKGVYAQPTQVLNIQKVVVHNLPNIYTNVADDGDVTFGNSNGVDIGTSYPDFNDNAPVFPNSIIDLTRVRDIQVLNISESGFDGFNANNQPGSLTIAGVRNGATLELDGGFTQDLFVHYGAGQGSAINVVLNVGDVESSINILQNSNVINIVSEGIENQLNTFFMGGEISRMVVSGTGALAIDNELGDSFNALRPAIIDASANSGGVDFILTHDEDITVRASTGDDDLNLSSGRDVVITGTTGNDEITVGARNLSIANGNGNNVINATVGFGETEETLGSETSITLGDGNNKINITPADEILNPGFDSEINIVVGDGRNNIQVLNGSLASSGVSSTGINYVDVVNIETGDGNNAIVVAGERVTIETGAGNDTITVEGFDFNITTNGGTDTITLLGADSDYVRSVDVVGDESDGGFTDNSLTDNGALIVIDTGAGTARINLGLERNAQNTVQANEFGSITAMEGSSITGDNVTIKVNSVSDLRTVDFSGLSGTTRVILDDNIGETGAALTVTAAQFAELGAAAFSVQGATFGARGELEIIITESVELADIVNLSQLSSAINLRLVVSDGATLALTAEQLHKFVAEGGLVAGEADNGDIGTGKVIITDAGLNFNPYDTPGSTPNSGSLGNFFDSNNVTVIRSASGFNRPEDVANTDTLTIVSNGTPIAGDINLDQIDDLSPAIDLVVTGGPGATFTGDVIIGDGASIDFSAVTGLVSGLTVRNAGSLTPDGNDTGTDIDADDRAGFGQIIGNGAPGTRVNLEFVGTEAGGGLIIGYDDAVNGGLISRGVQSFVVTAIDAGSEATVHVCDSTEDVTQLGMKGLQGKTVNFVNVNFETSLLLEGDGFASFQNVPKAFGNPNTSNIGTLNAEFFTAGADAVININNAGVALTVGSDGSERKLLVDAINITNARSIVMNVADGDVTINSLVASGVTSLTINASEDVAIAGDLPASITTVDASGVAGAFSAIVDGDNSSADTLNFTGAQSGSELTLASFDATPATVIDGGIGGVTLIIEEDTSVNLVDASLVNITQVVLQDASELDLTISQALAIGPQNFVVDPSTASANLNLSGLGEQEFSLDLFTAMPDLIVFAAVTVIDQPMVALHPGTDLTGIGSLIVPEGVVLNLTAAQFQQLNGAGSIVGVGGTTNFTVNITGLTQADVNAGFDLSDITAANVTVTLAEDVDLPADATGIVTDIALGARLTFELGAFQLSVPELDETDNVTFNGDVPGSTLEIRDITLNGADVNAANFNVDVLRISSLLVANANVDGVFLNLPEQVNKVIFLDEGVTIGEDQNVTIEAATIVPGSLTFNKVGIDTEIEDFTLNLSGGSVIAGDLDLRSEDETAGGADSIHNHLSSLTINSVTTLIDGAPAVNPQTGDTDNVIQGDITAVGANAQTENDMLNVIINADHGFRVDGSVIFTSVVGDDVYTFNDVDDAIANLTINGIADVTLGGLNTQDNDVDGLVVTNNSTGTLRATLDEDDIDATDALSFLGANIELTVEGDIDLSDDDLTGVTTITIGNGAEAGTVTLLQAQFNNLVLVDGTLGNAADAVLNLVEFGSAMFDATAVPAEIDVQNITFAQGVTLVHPLTNFTGVDSLTIPEGADVSMTVAQYQQLLGAGTINGLDVNGDMVVGTYTIRLTDLTNADVQFDESALVQGLNLTGITGGTGADAPKVVITLGEQTVTLGQFAVNGALSNEVVLNANTEFVLDTDQVLELTNSTQADGLEVSEEAGATNTTLTLRFANLDPVQVAQFLADGFAIDASGYTMDVLKALATFVDGTNVEQLIDNLQSSVETRYVNDPLQLGLVFGVNRVVVVEENVTVPDFVLYNDTDIDREVINLDMTLSGNSVIEGDVLLQTTMKDPGLTQQYFDTLTLRSVGAGPNVIEGMISGRDTANPDDIENDILAINIIAEQTLTIEDGIEFSSVREGGVAVLNVSGTADVIVRALNTADNTNGGSAVNDIVSLAVANNGMGDLIITGGTPGLNAGGLVSLILSGSGDQIYGNDQLEPLTGSLAEGITGASLQVIDASAMSGDLDLNIINSISSTNFTLTGGTGNVSLELDNQSALAPTLVAAAGSPSAPNTSQWTFDLSNALGGEMVIREGVILGSNNANASEHLSIDLGANAVLRLEGVLDFTALESLTITQGPAIVLAAGSVITLTAEQADGLIIMADPSITNPAMLPVVNVINLGAGDYDLSNIDENIAGTTTLAADDVTLSANTDLGFFSITLNDINSDPLVADELAGQTVRMSTVAQADGREIIVVGAEGTNAEQDTNVIWLFGSADVPLGTGLDASNYSADLGRVFILDELANGRNIEQLAANLPEGVIVRIDTEVVLNGPLTTVGFSRTVEVEALSDLSGGVTFTDIDNAGEPYNFVENLNITLGGEVNGGDIEVGNILASPPPSNDDEFNTLTLNSAEANNGDYFLLPDLQVGQRWGVGVEDTDTTAGVDREVITVVDADLVDNGNETITVNLLINTNVFSVVINNPAIDFSNKASIGAAIAAALDGFQGLTATLDALQEVVTLSGAPSDSVQILNVALGGTNAELDIDTANGTDVAQVKTITLSDTPQVNDVYTLNIALALGTTLSVIYTAQAGDDITDVTAGLAAALTALGSTELTVGAVGAVLTLTDVNANNGGFEAEVIAGNGRVALPTDANEVGDIFVDDNPAVANFDLGNVVVNTGTGASSNEINIQTIFFSDDGDGLIAAGTVARFTANGDSDVTVKSLNYSDTDLTGLIVQNNLNGATLTVTGGSPAVVGGVDITSTLKGGESLIVSTVAGATTIFGSTVGGVTYAGITGAELSSVTLTGGGVFNLGTIVDVDAQIFSLDASGVTGSTSAVELVLGEASANGTKAFMLSGSASFVFNSAASTTITITEDAVFNPGANLEFEELDTLNIEGDVDLSVLGFLSFTGPTFINVPLGNTLTMTAAQVLAAQTNGVEIDGDGSIVLVGEFPNGQVIENINVRNVDMTAVTTANLSDVVALDLSNNSPLRNHNVQGSLTAINDIEGGSGNDSIVGGALNDTFEGGLGNDTIIGGLGDDTAIIDIVTEGVDTVDLGAGDDTMVLSGAAEIRVTFTSAEVGNGNVNDAGNLANQDGGLAVRLQAEDGLDNLIGPVTRTDDEGITFEAATGTKLDVRDLVAGTQRGNDFDAATLGTQGDDDIDESAATINYYINAGQGNDSVQGGIGNDFLVGGAGNDTLEGNAGDDSFIGGAGNDSILGGAGNDTVLFNIATEGADEIDLGTDNGDAIAVSGAAEVRLTFTSAEVGNGDADDSGLLANQDGGLAVRMQAEDAMGNLIGAVTRVDDEGIIFGGVDPVTFATGTKFDVRDLVSGAQRGNQFDIVGLGTNQDDAVAIPPTINMMPNTLNYYVNTGMGNDSVVSASGNDFLVGGAGNDFLNGNDGEDSFIGGSGNDTIVGGAGIDTIVAYNLATDGEDAVDLQGGQDIINVSSTGATQLRLTFDSANVGNMTVSNNVTVQAEDGAGVPVGNIGTFDDEGNTFIAGAGATFDIRDLISGAQRGDDFDIAVLGTEVDENFDFSAQSVNYYVNAGTGNDTVLGGSGNDFLVGNVDNDTLEGNAGNDSFIGGAGNDSMLGGAGDDRFIVSGVNDNADTINGGADNDTLQVTTSYAPVADENLELVENVVVAGNAAPVNVNLANQAGEAFNVTLSDMGDTVTTADGNDSITGGTGIDSIMAGDGNDTINGASSDALIDGGLGVADVLQANLFDDANDGQVTGIEIVNATVDLLQDGADISLDAQTEGFTINGTNDDADAMTVHEGADSLRGGLGNDTINAGSGDDTIRGGAGIDSLMGEGGDDLFVFADAVELAGDATVDGGTGTDTVQVLGTTLVDAGFTNFINMEAIDFAGAGVHSLTLGAETNQAFANGLEITANLMSNLTVDGTAATVALDITGTDNTDALTGGSGNDTINGGMGIDSITGNGGSDSLLGGDGNDVIVGGSEDALIDGGNGVLDILEVASATFDDASDAQIVNVEGVFISNDTGTNLNLAQQTEGFNIVGSDDDNDPMTAANGRDTIVAGSGNDTINGESGNDSIDGGAGNDSIDGGNNDDTIIGGAGNDVLFGGSGVDTFVFTSDAIAETDTIGDWGNDQGGDILSGSLGAGDVLQVSFGATGGLTSNMVMAINGLAGVDAQIEFEELYDVGDRITLNIGGVMVTRTVTAGNTSGFAVAQDFADVLNSLNLNATDADLVNGGVTAVVLGTNGGQLIIENDNGGDGTITVSGMVDNADGILFDGLGDITNPGIAFTNGALAINGGFNDDTIIGGNGNDTIFGNDGGDIIMGSGGADMLFGEADDDTIIGGSGADTIEGGEGVDSLTGGTGEDVFVVDHNETDLDTITDFTAGVDLIDADFIGEYAEIDATALNVGNITALLNTSSAGNGSIVVYYNVNNTGNSIVLLDDIDDGSYDAAILLVGVGQNDISQADFI